MYTWWKQAFENHWATVEDLNTAMLKGQISEEQKNDILGQNSSQKVNSKMKKSKQEGKK